jgi:catechol 2,3-dioxygenase-like lactoylglutathione lyase family enzyme
MMRIKRIQHVSIGIEAGREAEARRFYGEILGLREKPRPVGLKHMPLIWYDVGDGEDEIHLIRMDPSRFRGPRAGDHLCIEVDDLAGFRERALTHKVFARDGTTIDHRPRFFVEDPFGNSIELVQMEGRYTPVDE